jgi:hypothetical protein
MRRMLGAAVVGSAAAAAAAAIGLAAPAAAHHGFGSFDLERDVTLKGELVGLDLVNPHSWLYLDVTGPDGLMTHYRCEMRSATALRRSGWSADMFTIGDTITVTGAPNRDDPNSCYVGTVTFADGSSIDRYGQRTPPQAHPPIPRRPDGLPDFSGDWAAEQLLMTDPRGIVGALVPMSVAEQAEPGEVPDGARAFPGSRGADPSLKSFSGVSVSLTEAGREAVAGYEDLNPETNPRMRCEATSVVFDWAFDTPIHRITQTDDTITIEYGQFGLVRTIHLDETEFPADISPSRAGYSIGRWEYDILVVETRGFAPGILYPPLPNSDRLFLTELFIPDMDGGAIRREAVAEDPVYYTDQFFFADTVYPADVPFAPSPCEDMSFVDYSAEVEAEE